MDSDDRHLADHIVLHIEAARLERQWANIRARTVGQAPARRISFAVAIAGAAVLALVVFVVTWAGARRAGSTNAQAQTINMPEGSRVTLARGADMRVDAAAANRVELTVRAGLVDFAVTHVDGRSFVVHAGGYDAIVVGTRFSVAIDERSGAATVSVAEGRVRVAGNGVERMLAAGESWSGPIAVTSSSAAASTYAGAASSVPARAEEPAGDSNVTAETSDARAGTSPSSLPSARPARMPNVEGPKELLARATTARQEGRLQDAAGALDTLRRRHRSDARAGLAAFELGRIRLDSLGDAAGAAEAFGDAIVLAPTAAFREDAEARRVEALDRLGDVARCESARDGYLSRYPTGIHVRQVTGRCAKR